MYEAGKYERIFLNITKTTIIKIDKFLYTK